MIANHQSRGIDDVKIFCHESIVPRNAKLSIPFCVDEGTVETVLRSIISVNQLTLIKACHVRAQDLLC